MKIFFSTSDNNINNPIVYTLSHSKNFYYEDLKSAIHKQKSNFIIVNKNITKEDCEKLIKETKKLDIIFIIPKKIKHIFLADNLNFTFYPIKPSEIGNLNKAGKKKKHNNFSMLLGSDGVLTNTENNKNIYLTETESSILALLLEKEAVDRVIIKEKILNLRESIDTKSLDSHLSRLRKKIRKINSIIEIVSTNHNKIKIGLPN